MKNASTPISTAVDDDGRSTTPMTPTSNDGAETSEGNATTIVEDAGTSTIATPTHVTEDSEDADKDDQAATTTIDEFSMGGNETTTLAPADGLSANTTVRPSFPSLEGVDYRMSEYRCLGVKTLQEER